MAAKAMVPVEAFPCIHRFRGHGPLLQAPSLTSPLRPAQPQSRYRGALGAQGFVRNLIDWPPEKIVQEALGTEVAFGRRRVPSSRTRRAQSHRNEPRGQACSRQGLPGPRNCSC
jgi:hypothetical protein